MRGCSGLLRKPWLIVYPSMKNILVMLCVKARMSCCILYMLSWNGLFYLSSSNSNFYWDFFFSDYLLVDALGCFFEFFYFYDFPLFLSFHLKTFVLLRKLMRCWNLLMEKIQKVTMATVLASSSPSSWLLLSIIFGSSLQWICFLPHICFYVFCTASLNPVSKDSLLPFSIYSTSYIITKILQCSDYSSAPLLTHNLQIFPVY